MPRFVLLITDLTAVHNEIACHARGIRLITREPHQLTRHDWDSAALVLVDAQIAPILRARPQPLPHRDAVTLLVDPDDKGEPDMYRHALDLGASHLVTVPDGAGALRKLISMMADSPRMVVAILDPAPTGEAGTITTACLALAGATAGEHLGLLDARRSGADLHGDLADAIAAGAGAGYPSMSASTRGAMPGESGHWSAALAGGSQHRRLWEVIARHRPSTGRPT